MAKRASEVKVNETIVKNINEQNKRISDYLETLMESDGLNWVKDWHAPMNNQHNPVTGTVYSGRNAFITAAVAFMAGFDDPRWLTKNQIEKHGYVLEQDEGELIPVYIEKWKRVLGSKKVEVKNADGTTSEEWRSFSYMKLVGGYVIYNAEQIYGIPPYETKSETMAADDLTKIADRFIATSRCKVNEKKTDVACYSPAKDEITMPKRGQFKNSESFLRTLLHEMGHSTAKPLHRDAKFKSWGDDNYAFEELVAELTSAFTAAAVGVDITDAAYTGKYAENHAAYLKSWLKACKDKDTAMFNAAALATNASLYLYQDYAGIDREALKAERKAKREAYRKNVA